MPYLVGIDVGTTGAKTVITDAEGMVVGTAAAGYPLTVPRPGWSEQDPADWWRATAQSIQGALAHARISPGELTGVGLTGQMHGLVLLDRDSEVLRPAILWNDQRTGDECRWITEQVGFGRLMELVSNPALPGFTAPKVVWVRRHEPHLYDRIAHILLPKDYIRHRLTGEFATDVSDASGTLLLHVGRRTWADELLRALDIPREWLPACSESPEISGRVTTSAAAATGLPAGLAVVGGAGDQAAQAVGSGVVRDGSALVTIGTSGVVFAHTDTLRVDAQGRLHTFCHAVPGRWHLMGVMLSAGGSLRWFRDALAQADVAAAAAAGHDPYELLTEEAGNVSPGSEGLVFLPYLTGERTPHPDPSARGAFVGLTLRHTRAHLVRAVLEGVAFGLRDSLELLRSLGQRVTEARVSGGGSRSPLWLQILADILGVELATVNVTEGAAYGAALLAGVATGVYPSVEDGCRRVVHTTRRIFPVPRNTARYNDIYELYRSLYPVLKPAFDRLAG